MPDTPHRQFSRLTSDSRRGLIATLIGAVSVLPFMWLTTKERAEGLDVLPTSTLLTLVWLLFFASYIAMTWWAFRGLDAHDLQQAIRTSNAQRNVRLERLGGIDLMSWVLTAVAAALIIVVFTLVDPGTRHSLHAMLLALALVVLAWLLMMVASTILLLRLDADRTAFAFPDDGPHGMDDYRYLATQVLTTFASSDVQVLSTAARKAITNLAIAAMVFNTVVVAILVSAFLTLVG